MRARIAAKSGGHAFEERFLKLDPAQLYVLFLQTLEEEKTERTGQIALIKKVNEVWFKKLDNISEGLQFFSNPKMYKAKLDLDKLGEHREEINEDNFLETWDQLMQEIPDTYVVDEPTASVEDHLMPDENDEAWEQMTAGWISNSYKYKED